MPQIELSGSSWSGGKYIELNHPSGIIWQADFTKLPLSTSSNASLLRSALSAMGLTLTRSSAATVQTGASTVVTSGIGVDDPRVGNAGYGRGLVLEEARTNYNPKCRSFLVADGWTNGAATITGDAIAGPDGSVSADRQQVASGAFGVYRTVLTATSSTTSSMWRRSGTGSTSSHAWYVVDGANAASNQNNALGATWERTSLTIATPGGGVGPISTCDGRTLGAPYNLTAGARDVALDLLQVEVGKFATEAIITTGAAATRSADKLTLSSASRVVRGGRLGLELRFIPKFALADGPSFPLLWNYDGNNQAYVRRTTGNVEVVVGGATYVSTSPIAWSAGDVVDVWIEAGGAAMQTVIKYRRNGGTVSTLGTSPSPQGIISAATLDFFTPANELSSWVQLIRAYAPGRRPQWAQ